MRCWLQWKLWDPVFWVLSSNYYCCSTDNASFHSQNRSCSYIELHGRVRTNIFWQSAEWHYLQKITTVITLLCFLHWYFGYFGKLANLIMLATLVSLHYNYITWILLKLAIPQVAKMAKINSDEQFLCIGYALIIYKQHKKRAKIETFCTQLCKSWSARKIKFFAKKFFSSTVMPEYFWCVCKNCS